MHFCFIFTLLLFATPAWAGAQPHMSSAFHLRSATGQGFELATRLSTDNSTDAAGSQVTLTEVALEVESAPGNPDQPGAQALRPPDRTLIQGTTTGAAWNPSLATALFLVAKGYISPADVSARLGFDVTVTRLRGASAVLKTPATDAIVIGILIAQLQAADPAAAMAVSRMIGNPDFVGNPDLFPIGPTLPAPPSVTGATGS